MQGEFQRKLRCTFLSYIENIRNDVNYVCFGTLGYDIGMNIKYSQHPAHNKTHGKRTENTKVEGNTSGEEEGYLRHALTTRGQLILSQEYNYSLIQIYKNMERLLTLFDENVAVLRHFKSLCHKGSLE